MTLYTKCILAEPSLEDGRRISVMSRHTLEDGVTPDARITASSYHEWWKDLAPSDALVGSYYRDGLKCEVFERLYIHCLRDFPCNNRVRDLARHALEKDITLLCVEHAADRCHRRLLAEECLACEPLLRIIHR